MAKGWHKESRRHSKASKKGWKNRRDAYNDLYTPRARMELKIKSKRKALQRPPYNLYLDRKRTSKVVLDSDIPYEANRYIKNPNSYDLKDTDTYRKQKKFVKEVADPDDDIIVGKIKSKSQPKTKKETFSEKKEIESIMDRTGATYFQARGLWKRAKEKGFDYDTVDWDQLQGKDLTYKDRIETLEQMVGKTSSKQSKYAKSDIQAMEQKLNQYTKSKLDEGTQVEYEHTNSKQVAQKIALDHLKEDINYYAKLKKCGLDEKIFSPNDTVIWTSPHSGMENKVSYRGKVGETKAIVWTGTMQIQVDMYDLKRL